MEVVNHELESNQEMVHKISKIEEEKKTSLTKMNNARGYFKVINLNIS